MNGRDDPASASWHLDRRVPIALIVSIAIQTAGIVWWASSISERVGFLERRELATAPHFERIIRLETRMESIAEYLLEIRNMLRSRGGAAETRP